MQAGNAQLAEWSFENISGNIPQEPIDPSFADPIIDGAGAITAGGSTTGSVDACSGAETWTTAFWPESSSRDPASYLSFVLSPEPGYGLSVSSFSFAANRTSQGPTQVDVYYSTDGFASEHFLLSGTVGEGPCTNLGQSLAADIPAGGSIEFRIYPYARTVNARTASIRIDNVAIMGIAAPVELSRFSARRIGSAVVLRWRTAREVHNAYFSIERSEPGKGFAPIGRVEGQGDSDRPRNYRFTDRVAPATELYYRLRQVDVDGFATYYGPVGVEARPAVDGLTLYPSVVEATFAMEWDVSTALPATEVDIHLLNNFGQMVRQWQSDAGRGFFSGDISGLPAGLYTVVLQRERTYLTRRLLKQ